MILGIPSESDFGDTFRKYQEVNIKSIKRIQDGMNSQEKLEGILIKIIEQTKN